MTPRGSAPGVRQSECSLCPPWVVRCVHVDGNPLVLRLADGAAPKAKAHDRVCGYGKPQMVYPRWTVALGKPVTDVCECGMRGNTVFRDVATRRAADRAFARFEAQLLGREPDDPPPTLQDEARWSAADYARGLAKQEERRRAR